VNRRFSPGTDWVATESTLAPSSFFSLVSQGSEPLFAPLRSFFPLTRFLGLPLVLPLGVRHTTLHLLSSTFFPHRGILFLTCVFGEVHNPFVDSRFFFLFVFYDPSPHCAFPPEIRPLVFLPGPQLPRLSRGFVVLFQSQQSACLVFIHCLPLLPPPPLSPRPGAIHFPVVWKTIFEMSDLLFLFSFFFLRSFPLLPSFIRFLGARIARFVLLLVFLRDFLGLRPTYPPPPGLYLKLVFPLLLLCVVVLLLTLTHRPFSYFSSYHFFPFLPPLTPLHETWVLLF